MILVNVYCAELRKAYDFKVDENAAIRKIIPELAEMISRSEQMEIKGKYDDFLLCLKRRSEILDRERTLSECRVGSGDQLMLV